MKKSLAMCMVLGLLAACGASPQPWQEIFFTAPWGKPFVSPPPFLGPWQRTALVSEEGNPFDTAQNAPSLFEVQPPLEWHFSSTPQRDLHKATLWARGRRVFGIDLKFSGAAESPRWFQGALPSFSWQKRGDIIYAESGLSQNKILSLVEEKYGVSKSCLAILETVWIPTEREFLPGYFVQMHTACEKKAPPIPRLLLVDSRDAQLWHLLPEGFGLVGSASVYRENRVVTPALTSEPLPDLDTGRALNGRYLRIKNCRRSVASLSSCKGLALGKQGVFTASPDSEVFDEIFAYYALSSAITWHKSQMSEHAKTVYGDLGLQSPLDILVRAGRKQSSSGPLNFDNASYLAHGIDKSGHPTIVVGTGWEMGDAPNLGRLQYLGRDADVYRHEFSHHIIIRAITDIDGQALALHEGFADYFASAQTGNNAIGESIVQNQPGALRQGNDLRPIDASLVQEEGHLQGEHWSSVLWEIRNAIGEISGRFPFDNLAWNSIDFLPSGPSYYHAIAALVKAADALAPELGINALEIRIKILTVFAQRGYFSSTEGVDEGKLPPPASFLHFAGSSGEAALVSSTRTYPKYEGPRRDQQATNLPDWQLRQAGCGIIGSKGENQSPLAAFVLFALPLLCAWNHRRVSTTGTTPMEPSPRKPRT